MLIAGFVGLALLGLGWMANPFASAGPPTVSDPVQAAKASLTNSVAQRNDALRNLDLSPQ